MNRTISREDIFSAAEASGFQRIEACCEGVPLKACSNDVWKGEVVAFVAELERIGGIGWQQAATWLCQHYAEFTDMGSLIKAMREAAPTAHSAEAQEPVAYVGWGGEGKPKTLLIREDLPVGTALYAKPMTQGELPSCDVDRMRAAIAARPMPQTDAARDGLTVERIRKIAETVRDKYGNQTWGQGYLEDADGSYTIPQLPAVFDDFARNLIAEIERGEREGEA